VEENLVSRDNDMYVVVQDGKILECCCGSRQEGKDCRDVPDDFVFVPCADVRLYDESWQVRPLEDRIKDGLTVVGKEEKIVDGQVVAKDRYERVRDGIDEAPGGMKLATDEDGAMSFEAMTVQELVAAGQMTQETADVINATNIRAERSSLLQASDSEIARINREIRTAQKSGTDTAALETELSSWDAYVQALCDVTEQPGFPSGEIVWPERPDGVAT